MRNKILHELLFENGLSFSPIFKQLSVRTIDADPNYKRQIEVKMLKEDRGKNPPTDEQKKELAYMAKDAFVGIRKLLRMAKFGQALYLADAFHNILSEMYEPHFSWLFFKMELENYYARFQNNNWRDCKFYLEWLDRIMAMGKGGDDKTAVKSVEPLAAGSERETENTGNIDPMTAYQEIMGPSDREMREIAENILKKRQGRLNTEIFVIPPAGPDNKN